MRRSRGIKHEEDGADLSETISVKLNLSMNSFAVSINIVHILSSPKKMYFLLLLRMNWEGSRKGFK